MCYKNNCVFFKFIIFKKLYINNNLFLFFLQKYFSTQNLVRFYLVFKT